MATTSSSSDESMDSLLCQVEDYPKVLASLSQSDELILLDDEDTGRQVGPSEGRCYGVTSTSGLSSMAIDINLS